MATLTGRIRYLQRQSDRLVSRYHQKSRYANGSTYTIAPQTSGRHLARRLNKAAGKHTKEDTTRLKKPFPRACSDCRNGNKIQRNIVYHKHTDGQQVARNKPGRGLFLVAKSREVNPVNTPGNKKPRIRSGLITHEKKNKITGTIIRNVCRAIPSLHYVNRRH